MQSYEIQRIAFVPAFYVLVKKQVVPIKMNCR